MRVIGQYIKSCRYAGADFDVIASSVDLWLTPVLAWVDRITKDH